MKVSDKYLSAVLLGASLLVTLLLLAFGVWLLSVSSFGTITSSSSPTPYPDPSHISLGTRYALFLGGIALDKWLIVPLLVIGIAVWFKWQRDRLFCIALAILGVNLLLVYHIVFILLNSSMNT
jgi:hypothetical protein